MCFFSNECITYPTLKLIEALIRGDAQKVRLGTSNIVSPSIHLQEIGIAERVSHPEYSARSKYNDIALLRLDVAAHINEFVRPACLAVDVSLEWSTALAVGFGRLAYGK